MIAAVTANNISYVKALLSPITEDDMRRFSNDVDKERIQLCNKVCDTYYQSVRQFLNDQGQHTIPDTSNEELDKLLKTELNHPLKGNKFNSIFDSKTKEFWEKADVNKLNDKEQTALHVAAENGHGRYG